MRTYQQLLHLPHNYIKTSHALFTSITLRTFFFAYFSLFIPIIIFQYYKHLGSSFAINMLGVIYLVISITPILAFPAVTKTAARFGYKPILITSLLFLFTGLLLMKYQFFFPGALLFGFSSIAWWISYYIIFLDSINIQHTGKNVGLVETLGALSGIIAPLIGGLILTYTNQSIFFLTSIAVICLAIIPLISIKNRFTTHSVSYTDLIKLAVQYPKDFFAFIGAGGEGFIYAIYWPLFLFLLLKSQLSLGIFASVITLIAAIASYILGKRSDHKKAASLYQKIGTTSFSISWLGKSLWQTPLAWSLFDIIHRIFNPFFVIPLNTTSLYHAQKGSQSTYITFREISYRIGNVIAILISILIIHLGLPFWLIFVIAAFLSLTPMKIN
ncbi:MAG: MFS transporter [bacterium]|nr:MFS transporter [bacterium]